MLLPKIKADTPTVSDQHFKWVNYLWDNSASSNSNGDEVALLIYRSNLLGSDLRITNYGGGNTSCKTFERDPITGEETEVMWVKGSGGDLKTLNRSDLAALYTNRLRELKKIYRGIEFEDELVELFNHCIYDLKSKAPSIDTPLHAFLPFKHIDHLHPDAVISIAAAKDGKRITQELFNGSIGWINWQKPGFDLGLKLQDYLIENPNIEGIILGSHGLFTWGNTSYECYLNSLNVIERCAEYIAGQVEKKPAVFGGVKIKSVSKDFRLAQAVTLAPILRGYCSSLSRKIGHFTDNNTVLEFVNSVNLHRLAPMGTSCPDHFLRTKINPLILSLEPDEDLSDVKAVKAKLEDQFNSYRNGYSEYYEKHKQSDSPSMRDPNPVIILYPGIGMFSFAKNKTTARIASEFYINAINVMRGSEAISQYTSLPRQEAFNIEYWQLEEAKLKRLPPAKALEGKIALITGSAGGIGKAIAKKLAAEGASIIINDINKERLKEAESEFQKDFNNDTFISSNLDVTNVDTISDTIASGILAFGGLDIIVNNAGISISKPIEEHSDDDLNLLFNVLVKGQFNVTKLGIEIMRKQGMGGDILNIVSKNSLMSGPDNTGYGSAKAAQLHLSRLSAAELGKDKIRVNVVNPDAVILGSNIWNNGWAEGRAKAYGIKVEDLPSFYASRTLLNEPITPEDIADACFVFISGLLNKSTGNIINVDGGISAAFVR
jgi:rhamnulose-1-phosphate aldolase/alcohol dehydrogenase